MDPANVKDKMTDKLKDGQIEKRGIGFDIKKPTLTKIARRLEDVTCAFSCWSSRAPARLVQVDTVSRPDSPT